MPPLCMPELGKRVGRGLIRGIVTFSCDDHYRLSNTMWARDLFSLAVWWAKFEKDDIVYMTQIASLLAIATVFIGLWTLI